jgi:hypothetical protein
MEKAALELTAVVEPLRQGSVVRGQWSGNAPRRGNRGEGTNQELDSERVAAYRFAVETMEEHRIRVLTTADLGRAAETARRELRV